MNTKKIDLKQSAWFLVFFNHPVITHIINLVEKTNFAL